MAMMVVIGFLGVDGIAKASIPRAPGKGMGGAVIAFFVRLFHSQ